MEVFDVELSKGKGTLYIYFIFIISDSFNVGSLK